jgi:4-carboxymuconolactone decarboxylase
MHRRLIPLLACLFLAGHASAQRLPPISIDHYSREQAEAAAEFTRARNSPPVGPFLVLMHSPRFMNHVRAMGDYLRFNSALPAQLSEFATLVVAREWSSDYEWGVHQPLALKAGVPSAVVDALAEGRRPVAMSDDQRRVYDFCMEVLKNKGVSDATFQDVQARFGPQGVVDLSGIIGYFSLVSMQLNVARYRSPGESAALTRLPQ